MTDTVHLGLPVIEAAQAQKHVTHNEALAVLDVLVMLAVLDRDLSEPPVSPAEGDRYLVKAPGTGSFDAKDNQIAHFLDGTWTFLAPAPGWTCFVEDEETLVAWTGTTWQAVGSGEGGGGEGPITELQNLLRLGLGTAADATNPFAASLNNALWTAKPVAEGGDGSLRYKLSKESIDKTLSFLFQDNYSGRAEIGLTGDDDFHFKVSADGSTWADALIIDGASAAAKFAAALQLTGAVSPAQLTSDQNDYAPAGFASASVLRLSSDASRAITGLAGGASGRIVFLHNYGTNAIVLKDENASSATANRFALAADLTISPDRAVLLLYDGTSSRWRVIGGASADGKSMLYGSGAPGAGTGNDGDFYIDTSAHDLYGPKAAGSWPAGTSLIGPAGSGSSYRNRARNGDMRLAQRATSATVTAGTSVPTASSGEQTVDGFFVYSTGADITVEQTTDGATGQNRLQITGATSVTEIGVGQRIAASDIKDLQGQDITFSVKLANSLLTTVTWTAYYPTGSAISGADGTKAFGTIGSPTKTQIATGTFTVSSTEDRYAAHITLPAVAKNGLEIVLTVGAQTSGTLTATEWQVENGTIDAVDVIFEVLPIALVRSICEEFCEYTTTYDCRGATDLVYASQWVTFRTRKFIIPTIITYDDAGASGAVTALHVDGTAPTNYLGLSAQSATVHGWRGSLYTYSGIYGGFSATICAQAMIP